MALCFSPQIQVYSKVGHIQKEINTTAIAKYDNIKLYIVLAYVSGSAFHPILIKLLAAVLQ